MKRDVPGHYLKRNHSRSVPSRIMVLDTETTASVDELGEAHRYRLGWSVVVNLDEKGRPAAECWRYCTSAADMIDLIERSVGRDVPLWLLGNNIYFDLQAMGFFRAFTDRGWTLRFFYDSATTYILIIEKGRHCIKALSVTNYWSASIRDLGMLLGLPKIDVDFTSATDDELCIYCFRDTEIALEAMLKYISIVVDGDLGAVRLSRAAQSYAAYRHRFMHRPLFIHADADIRSLESAAYMGGRTESYRIGSVSGGPFTCYDVNSMYPFIMSRYRLPYRCVDYWGPLSASDVVGALLEYGMIAEAELDTDEPLYAYRLKGKIIFPIGRFTTYLCTEGLRQAALRGHLKGVTRAAFYLEDVLFRSYIDELYAMRVQARQRGDATTGKLLKLLMNSLYGKLAQRRPIVVSDEPYDGNDYFYRESLDYDTGDTIIESTLFHRKRLMIGDELCPSSVPSVPAHITEYGRMLLYDVQERIGREHVVYCDTDSVFVDAAVSDKVGYPVDPNRLGALSRRWTTDRLVIYGAKDYMTDNDVVVKGIPPDAEEVAPREYVFSYWPSQRAHMKRGIDDRYIIRTTVRNLNRAYDKGKVNADGSVSPWKLPDLLRSDDLSIALS